MQSFDCNSCHQQNEAGEITRSPGYESCQSCHDESLRLETSHGFALITIPSLPSDLAGEAAPWPSAATGFADGRITPLVELLLRRDKPTATAIRSIVTRDFGSVNLEHRSSGEAMVTVAKRTSKTVKTNHGIGTRLHHRGSAMLQG